MFDLITAWISLCKPCYTNWNLTLVRLITVIFITSKNRSNNRRDWPNGSGQQTLYEKLKKKVLYGLFPEFKWWIDSPYYSRLYTITCNILYKAIFFFRLNSQYTFKANQCKCRNLLMALPKYIFTGLQFYLYRTRNTFMYIISPILRHSRGQLLKSG